MEGAAEDDVQGRRVDDEDAEAGAGEDTEEVVLVADDAPAEGEGEFGFDRKHLRGGEREETGNMGEQERELTLKHCMMKMDR